MSLKLETARIEPDITVVRVTGSLITGPDGHALEGLVRDLLVAGEKKLILDLCSIEEIDSFVCQYLIQCSFTARRATGELRLASANPRVARLLDATRLDTPLPFYRTVTAAAAGFALKKGA